MLGIEVVEVKQVASAGQRCLPISKEGIGMTLSLFGEMMDDGCILIPNRRVIVLMQLGLLHFYHSCYRISHNHCYHRHRHRLEHEAFRGVK